MQAQHVFDVTARAPPAPSSSSHEVVGNEQEASSVDAVGVPGHDRRKLGDRPGRRITLQQEVQHRHHRCLARPEAGMQAGGLRSAIGQGGCHQGEGPIAGRSDLRGDDVSADRALRLVDGRGETYDKVSVVGSVGKAVDGVVLCTSKPDHRLRERLPHRLRVAEAPGNDLSRKCDRQALGELQPLDRFGSDPRRQVDLRWGRRSDEAADVGGGRRWIDSDGPFGLAGDIVDLEDRQQHRRGSNKSNRVMRCRSGSTNLPDSLAADIIEPS